MKRIVSTLIILFTLAFIGNRATAQVLSIGPSIGIKSSTNYAPKMIDRKNEMRFSQMPDLGLSAFWQLYEDSPSGLGATLSYSSYAYGIKSKSMLTHKFSYSYLTFSPYVNVSNIFLSFSFGLPMNGKYVGDIPTDNLRVMSEVSFGYMMPVLREDDSSLNLYLSAGIMLTNMYYDFPKNDPLKSIVPVVAPDMPSDKFNPRCLSIGFGLNYLFNIYANYEEPDPIEP